MTKLTIKHPSTYVPVIVEMENKPALAKYYEQPKIRDYTPEQRNSNAVIVAQRIFDLLAFNDDEDKYAQQDLAIGLINTYTSFSYEEIIQAFTMYSLGQLELEVYREFNATVLGKVMNRYKVIRDARLTPYLEQRKKLQYKEPEMSTEEKNRFKNLGVMSAFRTYTSQKYIPVGYNYIYDYLVELGLINPTPEERKRAYEIALKDLEEKSKEIPLHEAKKLLKELEEKNAPTAIIYAKNLLICNYFSTLTKNKLEQLLITKNKEN